MNAANLALARARLRGSTHRHGWVVEGAERYHAGGGLGSSHVKRLAQGSPAHFFHDFLSGNSKPPTPAMRFGTLAHEYILEMKRPTVRPATVNARTKEGREWAATTHGAVCTADELEALQQMSMGVNWALSTRGLSLEQADCEVSGYAIDPLFGFELRIRPDARFEDRGVLLDLKTCTDASREGFARAAWNLGYHIQAAFYMNVANLIAGEERYREWWWAAVETTAPHVVTIHRASPALLEAGTAQVIAALTRLNECLASGHFPGPQEDGGFFEMEPPRWAKAEGADA